MTHDDLLDSLLVTLRHIDRISPRDLESWERQPLVQLAVERLWITAGNVAEEYRRCAELPRSVDPWSQLYARRSKYAHALVGDLSPARVWNETIDELDELIAQIGALCNDPPLG